MGQLTYEELVIIAEGAVLLYPLVTVPQLLSVWWLESDWNPNAVNKSSWATGLGGIMSRESGDLSTTYYKYFHDRPTIEELKNPTLNAEWSAKILSGELERTGGDERQAIKNYSGGWKIAGDDAFERQYWQPYQKKKAEIMKLYGGGQAVATDFSRYPRPCDDTGAGVHAGANAYFPLGDNEGLYHTILDEMYSCGLRWVKILDADGSSYNACMAVLDHGMMPVVRMYRHKPYPGTLTDKQREVIPKLVSLGVRYFERGNEPNLTWEWKDGTWPGNDWNKWTDETFRQLAQEWYQDAKYIADCGGLVALDACSGGGNYDDIYYIKNFYKQLKLIDGAMSLLYDHAWIATHPAGLNHPLDYPDDPINQAEHPGATIMDDSNCIRKSEAVIRIFQDYFGFQIPVLATEGGFWPGRKDDNRYPELTNDSASMMNFDTLHSMRTAPPWYFAFMPWLWANRIFANTWEDFERDAWKRIPGYGNCPETDVKELPIIPMLLANPCRRREEIVMPSNPTPTPPPESASITATELERCREAFYTAPASVKRAYENGLLFVREVYQPGDAHCFSIGFDSVDAEYVVLKIESKTWQVVAEAAL